MVREPWILAGWRLDQYMAPTRYEPGSHSRGMAGAGGKNVQNKANFSEGMETVTVGEKKAYERK